MGSAAVIGTLALLKIFVFSGKKEQAAAPPANSAIPVECFIARDTLVQHQVETVGTLNAREQVNVVSEVARKVVDIQMKDGAMVRKDQLLFKLDDADITSRIKKLGIQARQAAANEAREKVLLANGGISQEKFDETSTLRQSLEAEIEVLKVDLAKTEIRAPFAGKIGLRNTSLGALVAPGHVLANLQDVSKINLDFSVPERYSRDLHPGAPVSFRTDYLPDELMATVEAVEPAVDQRTRTMLVRASLLNPDGRLVPGTSAKVNLTLAGTTMSLYVPTSTLMPSTLGYTVFRKKLGQAEPVQVRTGTRSREFIQILDGLNPGDTVVTTNLLRIKKGSPLTIIKTY